MCPLGQYKMSQRTVTMLPFQDNHNTAGGIKKRETFCRIKATSRSPWPPGGSFYGPASVAVGVSVGVADAGGVFVGWVVGVAVAVAVGGGVCVGVAVEVGVRVTVGVNVGGLLVGVGVKVRVGVGVGPPRNVRVQLKRALPVYST